MFFLLAPQWLRYLRGQSPLEAALWFLPFILGVGPASAAAPVPVQRLGAGRVGAVGMVVMGGALGAMGLIGSREASLWWFAAAVATFAFGFGLAATPGTSLIVGGLPGDRRTLSAAVNDVTREVGGALGGALGATVLLVAYSARIDQVPGLSERDAAVAEDGFAQAVGLAGQLPDGLRQRLLAAATDAFEHGYTVAMLLAATVLAISAVVVLMVAPRREEQA